MDYLTRNYLHSPRISMWKTFFAVMVINTCLNNCHLASATKEDVDEQALQSMKSNEMGSTWKPLPPPCFYPCFHSNLYNFGDDGLSNHESVGDFEKRNFNPWGGKRSPSPISEYFRQISDLAKKGGFNPWGGKRNPTMDTSRSTKDDYPSARRLPFNPWGGR